MTDGSDEWSEDGYALGRFVPYVEGCAESTAVGETVFAEVGKELETSLSVVDGVKEGKYSSRIRGQNPHAAGHAMAIELVLQYASLRISIFASFLDIQPQPLKVPTGNRTNWNVKESSLEQI